MSAPSVSPWLWRVVRLDLPLDPYFDALLRADPRFSLAVCDRHEVVTFTQLLSQAHVYHVSSAKDELPRHGHVDEALLSQCPQLLCVTTYGAGYDTVDVPACTRAGVLVVNQAGSNANAVAEHTLGLLLGLSKRIVECDRRLRAGVPFARHLMMGADLHGRTLGLVGIGHIGRRVAALAQAFGMQVLAFDPLLDAAEIGRRGARGCSLPELLHAADAVSVHCPLNDDTRGLFDASAYASMKRGAWFITTARGGIHDEGALYEALCSGHLAGAGLDVWAVEPPPAEHPLLSLDCVIGSFHIAGVTTGARRGMAGMAAGQLIGLLDGTRPANLVNPEAWPVHEERARVLLAPARVPSV